MLVRKRGVLRSWVVAMCAIGWGALVIGGCSEESRYQVLSFFFEGVPKPGEKPQWQQVVHEPRRPPGPKSTPTPVAVAAIPKPKYPPGWLPALLKTMPHDAAGYPDMVAAFNEKKIDPMAGVEVDHVVPKPKKVDEEEIELIKTGKTKCSFSHQVHTTLITCKSCHSAIFKMTIGEKLSMDDCATCHEKIAFPIKGECVRCHPAMKKKAPKEPPKEKLLEGDIKMTRAKSSDANSMGIPPATFPHLAHRVNYRCYACHNQIFPMKEDDKKPITMEYITDGKSCGVCHNGRIAFAGDDLGTCSRCHY
jgi:c(7)-type cytochrome triheme protein